MYGYVTLGTPAVVTRRRIEGVWFMAAVLPELLSSLALCCIGGMGLACTGKEKSGNN